MKIAFFRLRGYIKVLNGMGLDEIAIPFGEFRNRIVLIQGENGTAKSTVIGALTPNPDSSDDFRTDVFFDEYGNRQIVEYPAEKEIHYVGYDDFGMQMYVKILIQSIVDESKTRRTTKAFISKNGEELNPNGNVTSFKEIRDSVLGIDPIYLDLSSISAENRGIVDMIPSERRKYMASYIGSLDTYNNIFKILSKKVTSMKSYMNTLNSKMYSLGNENEIAFKAAQCEATLKDYNLRRDELLKQLADAEATVRLVDPDNKMQDLYASILERLESINSQIKQIQPKCDRMYTQLGLNPQNSDIGTLLQETENSISTYQSTVDSAKSKIQTLITLNESTMETLERDRTILSGLSTNRIQDNTYEAAEKLRKEVAEYESYVNTDIDILEKVSFDELVDLRDTLAAFTNEIMATEELYGLEEFNEAVDRLRAKTNDFNPDKLRQSITDLDIKIADLNRSIEDMESDLKEAEEFADKRPKDCNIDTCPFIAKYTKLGNVDDLKAKILVLKSRLELLECQRKQVKQSYENSKAVDEIVSRLDMAVTILYAKSSVIKKIPGVQYILNLRKLKDDLKNLHRHSQVEGALVSGLVEEASIYSELKKAKDHLKELDAEISSYNSNKTMIESLEISISNAESIYDDRTVEIQGLTSDINFSTNLITTLSDKLNKLKELKESTDSIFELNVEKGILKGEFDSVKDKIKLVKEKLDSVNLIKSNISRIEEAIEPLKDTMGELSYTLTSLMQCKNEFAECSNKYDKMVFIRNACSPGNGKGIQSEYVKKYMNDIIIDCNKMLGYMFGGAIRLDVPVINEKQFSIPFLGPNGIMVPDISYGSTAQKCMIGLVFSCVAMMKSSIKYNIPRFDEIDGGLDQQNRITFINVLNQILDFMHSEQCVICSHNMEFDTQNTTRLIFTHQGIRIEQ